MSSVNPFTREIAIKIVYYGPAFSGKTSCLEAIHRALKPASRGRLVSLATGADRTLYLDFVPVQLARPRGDAIRVQLYTVPGEVRQDSTRQLLLAGADGVVFVADSQRDREGDDVESCETLREELDGHDMRLERLPHICQLNKRDLPDVLTVDELNRLVNPLGAPLFESVATTGRGVFDALRSITALVLNDLHHRGIWGGGFDVWSCLPPELDEAGGAAHPRPRSGPLEATPPLAASSPRGTNPRGTVLLHGDPHRPRSDSLAPRPLSPTAPPPARSGLDVAPAASPLPGDEGLLARLLPPGTTRERVAAAEAEVARGRHAEAVLLAAQAFTEAAEAESSSAEIAPVLHALMRGMSGPRYLRLCDAAARAEKGLCSVEDAVFAIFFLVDASLEK